MTTSPLDRILERTARLIDSVEAGVPIDYQKEARLSALETVEAGAELMKEQLERTNAEDDRFIAWLEELDQ